MPLPRPVSASSSNHNKKRLSLLGCTAARVTAACLPAATTLHSSDAPSSMDSAAHPGCRRLPRRRSPAHLLLRGPPTSTLLGFSVLQAPPARQVQS